MDNYNSSKIDKDMLYCEEVTKKNFIMETVDLENICYCGGGVLECVWTG
ncbi:MAG: hypothetical protein H6Q68_2258 [Firmicutes bacterium]|nr:hypothetical protein [Bacillota bacterium]